MIFLGSFNLVFILRSALLGVLSLGILVCECDAAWRPTNGPPGGATPMVTVSGSSILVDTETAVFRSADGGTTWNKSIPELTGYPWILSMNAYNGKVVLGTGDGLFLFPMTEPVGLAFRIP
jgi:hypothetical protein